MTQNIVAIHEDSDAIAGAIVWWSLKGTVDYQDLCETLRSRDLDESWDPPEPRIETVAQRAANAAATGSRQLVRPLKKRGEYEFVTEYVESDGAEDTLEYRTNARVQIVQHDDGQKQVEVVARSKNDVELATKIGENVRLFEGLLTATDVSNWLLGVLTNRVYAVSLRTRGGFYFVPAGKPLQCWRVVVSVLGDTSAHTTHSISAMRTDASAVEAVLASVRREASELLAELDEYLSGKTSTRGLNAWSRNIAAVQEKTARYAELLGVELPEISDKAENLQGAIQAAKMQDAAAAAE